MMGEAYYNEEHCEPIHRRDHHKTTSIMSFMNVVIVVSISLITFVASFIGGLLVKFFIL